MHAVSAIFIELGAVAMGLALLARLASRWGLSAISLYLIAGLCFGKGGVAPLDLSQDFIRLGAELGVLLLLFVLGLEYGAGKLRQSLRSAARPGLVDILLNFTPGFIFGLLMGWRPLPCVLLGGVTYVSSSGIIARLLTEFDRMKAPETPHLLGVLVFEDLTMAIYLPLVAVVMAGGSPLKMLTAVLIAVAAVAMALLSALRYGPRLSRTVEHESDEIVLLSVFGAVLLVAGVAERFQVSSAIGAFLVGIALSGPAARQAKRLIEPLRDLFAATFFFFFGMEIDPSTLTPVLVWALGLAIVTGASKIATGWWTTRRFYRDWRLNLRAGLTLLPRGEFSIVIAGLGAAVEPRLSSLAAAYVLLMAVAGPLLLRLTR